MALKAWIGNCKIFGTPGVNDNTTYAAAIQGLEDAVTDHMDIAVLAFGSLPLNGPLDQNAACAQQGGPSTYQYDCDIPAQALENAVAMGLTVVAAGNGEQSGYASPSLNSIDSPAQRTEHKPGWCTVVVLAWRDARGAAGVALLEDGLGSLNDYATEQRTVCHSHSRLVGKKAIRLAK
jgi:hypothetical protein